jgi:hypothetical protein
MRMQREVGGNSKALPYHIGSPDCYPQTSRRSRPRARAVRTPKTAQTPAVARELYHKLNTVTQGLCASMGHGGVCHFRMYPKIHHNYPIGTMWARYLAAAPPTPNRGRARIR